MNATSIVMTGHLASGPPELKDTGTQGGANVTTPHVEIGRRQRREPRHALTPTMLIPPLRWDRGTTGPDRRNGKGNAALTGNGNEKIHGRTRTDTPGDNRAHAPRLDGGKGIAAGKRVTRSPRWTTRANMQLGRSHTGMTPEGHSTRLRRRRFQQSHLFQGLT